jgi:hypothetical protein
LKIFFGIRKKIPATGTANNAADAERVRDELLERGQSSRIHIRVPVREESRSSQTHILEFKERTFLHDIARSQEAACSSALAEKQLLAWEKAAKPVVQ